MKASTIGLHAAVLFLTGGMIWGIILVVSEDFSAMSAHAHLSLLGWVSLFLFSIYYRSHPSLDRARSASVQVWIWVIGTIILTLGVRLVNTGHEIGGPIAAVGSIVVLFDALLFGYLLFGEERAKPIDQS